LPNGSFGIGDIMGQYSLSGLHLTIDNLTTGMKGNYQLTWSPDAETFWFAFSDAKTKRRFSYAFQRVPPVAQITDVKLEFDKERYGRKGVTISTKVTMDNAPALPCEVVAHFLDDKGNRLRADNPVFSNLNGNLTTRTLLTPGNTPSEVKEVVLFIPFEEFIMTPGRHKVQIEINVWCPTFQRTLEAQVAKTAFTWTAP